MSDTIVEAPAGNWDLKPVDAPSNWPHLVHHPHACLAEMVESALEPTAAFMQEYGYDPNEPVVLIETADGPELLDGRLRHGAALVAGIVPPFALYVGDNPLAYVLKKLHRQHHDQRQLAVMADRLIQMNAQRRQRAIEAGETPEPKLTQEAAADMVGVTRTSVTAVNKIRKNGVPELLSLFTAGSISVADAEAIAEMSHEQQRRHIKAFEEGKTQRIIDPPPTHQKKPDGAPSSNGSSKPKPKPAGDAPKGGGGGGGGSGRKKGPPDNGQVEFSMKEFEAHLGKAWAEVYKFARSIGDIDKRGHILETPELTALRGQFDVARKGMESWFKAAKHRRI